LVCFNDKITAVGKELFLLSYFVAEY